MRRTVRETLLGFRRTPLLAALSIIMIAFSLYSVSLFGLVAINFRKTLGVLAERVEVVAFVLRGTPAAAITQAADDIAGFPEVLDVQYVSESDALARAQRELVEFREAYQDLATNPLPASLELKLRPEFRNAAAAQAVAERLAGYRIIDDVRYGQEWVQRLDRLRNVAAAVGLVIGAAFALVAVVIIGVTIRMTVLQRAREITIMRLVGATDAFIRRPFLIEGALRGVLGGLLAIAMSWGSFTLFGAAIGLDPGSLVFFTPQEASLGVVAGLLLGFGGSAVSVGRHLRRV